MCILLTDRIQEEWFEVVVLDFSFIRRLNNNYLSKGTLK